MYDYVIGPLVMLWSLGALVAWPFIYYLYGFNEAKRYHGVDWREFNVQFGLRWFAWPYFAVRLALGHRELAVVRVNGHETRELVDLSRFSVYRAEATSELT